MVVLVRGLVVLGGLVVRGLVVRVVLGLVVRVVLGVVGEGSIVAGFVQGFFIFRFGIVEYFKISFL